MKPTALTYIDLIERLNYLVSTKQLNENTAGNRASALRAFLRANHLSEEDVVGEEMRSKFPDHLERFLDALRAADRKQRNITNTRAALTPLRQMVQEDDIARALDSERPTPFVQQLKALLGSNSIKRVANVCGVPYDMVLGWLHGKLPRPASAKYVHRLENYFSMERGELWKLTGVSHPARMNPELPGAAPIPYREGLGALTRLEYWLVATAESPLRQQWHEFMVYKTALVPELERSSKGRWRISPLPMGQKSDRVWWKYLDHQEVASAQAGWSKVAGYLGWLGLPTEQGGAGLPEAELHTLAWLAVPDHIERYLNWKKERSGGKHTTYAPEFLGWVMSLVRPVQGYFVQSDWLQATLPQKYQRGPWLDLCQRQFKFCQRMTQSLRGQVEVSRDPFAPLGSVLELAEPMEALVDMIQRMRAIRPIASPMLEAVWSRDLVLIKLLASNPLRHRNVAHMTWKPDNTGNLYQKVDGSWHVRFKSGYFKNSVGAAGDIDYDAEVQPSVWVDLERYIHQHRPRLLRHSTDLVFITKAKCKEDAKLPHEPWDDLSKRVFYLTRKYLWNCPGAGAHSFRHLIGSSIVKAAPDEILTAAKVLNDRPATVEKHYARFKSSDGARRMGELLGKSFRRM